jgi:hypothetical protein
VYSAQALPIVKQHIVKHLVCDALVPDARFQDAHVANSDTGNLGQSSGFGEDAIVVVSVGGDNVVGAEVFLGVDAGGFANSRSPKMAVKPFGKW